MGIQKKDREYERFLDQISDFIFVEDKPERADIIFVPGNGFPQMSIEAAQTVERGNGTLDTAFRKIQYRKRCIYRGTGHEGKISGTVSDGMGIYERCAAKRRRAGRSDPAGRRGYIYLSECDQLQKSDGCSGHSGEKGNYLLQSPACQKMQAVLSVLIPTDNLSHLPFGCGNQPGKLV